MLKYKPETVSVNKESASLRFLYNTAPGRLLLRPLSSMAVSGLCGRFLDSGLSKPLVGRFVRKYSIDLDDYQSCEYNSFNEFFTREIKSGRRPVDADPDALTAPCDGFLSAYHITEDTVIPVKQSRYTISALLGGATGAEKFKNGLCLVFRLCVDNYHRYCYIDDGTVGESAFIKGRLHTVRPIALRSVPVFTENCREYTFIETEHFGEVAQIEVGAMLVGKIKNHPGKRTVRRGEEKGMFLYGGSTVIVLLQEGRVSIPEEIFEATEGQAEIPVRMGQKIGQRA